jgi:hypothetical protein
VFDTDSGRLAYVVLSTGGTSGAATGKLFAIPTRALKMNTGQDEIVLNIDKDRLLNAPSFESGTWPNMANREWDTEVHRYYGFRPYWEETGAGGGTYRPITPER